MSKVNFPKEALVIAAIGHPLLDFMIRLVLVAFVFIWYGVPFKAQMIFVPFILPTCHLASDRLELRFIHHQSRLARYRQYTGYGRLPLGCS